MNLLRASIIKNALRCLLIFKSIEVSCLQSITNGNSNDIFSHFQRNEKFGSNLSTDKISVETEHSFNCLISQSKLESLYGYRFSRGYKKALQNSSLDNINAFVQLITSNATYVCENKASLLEYQYESHNGDVFDGQAFLSLLRNRNISIIGDSLALQQFLAIENELSPLVDNSKSHNGNGTHLYFEKMGDGTILWMPPPNFNAAIRHYKDYNVSMFFCNDGVLDIHTMNRGINDFCVRKFIGYSSGGVLILGSGAWYKPLSDGNFTLNSIKSVKAFKKQMFRVRYHLNNLLHKPTQIIWRLLSRVGPIDEYLSVYPDKKFAHQDGIFWDSHKYESKWVADFNFVLRSVAHYFGDYILDHHMLSTDLITFAEYSAKTHPKEKRVQIHADSLHYCAGGLFRAGNLLVQKTIEHGNKCRNI